MKEHKNEKKKAGLWVWLGVVAFLLVFPPGLPFALSSDNPILGSIIAVGVALVLGTLIWKFSDSFISFEEKKATDRRKGLDRRDIEAEKISKERRGYSGKVSAIF